MSELNNRKQVGPMTLNELVDFICTVHNNPNDEEQILEAKRKELEKRQTSCRKRSLIRVFEGYGQEDCFVWNDNIILEINDKDVILTKNLVDDTPDYLAFYNPWFGNDRQTGIYFVRKTVLKILASYPGIDVKLFLETIAVHELFHYFVERFMYDKSAYKNHTCLPYCYIEEAAADYAAYTYAEQNPAGLAGFKDIILKEKSAGGLPGYGEYGNLDHSVYSAIEYLKNPPGGKCVQPADYLKTINILQTDPALFAHGGSALWEATLKNANSGEIAFFYDMVN